MTSVTHSWKFGKIFRIYSERASYSNQIKKIYKKTEILWKIRKKKMQDNGICLLRTFGNVSTDFWNKLKYFQFVIRWLRLNYWALAKWIHRMLCELNRAQMKYLEKLKKKTLFFFICIFHLIFFWCLMVLMFFIFFSQK